MVTVRDLIMELLEYNFDATVSLNALYEESETVNFSWTGEDGGGKRECNHVFLETESRYCETLEKTYE